MARRVRGATASGRPIIQNVPVGVLGRYGDPRRYGQYSTGGSSMLAILGPDAGGGNRDTNLAVIRDMNTYSAAAVPRGPLWIAGHLLNGELGGNGLEHRNLTPLTEEANRNHATYEQYIKRIVNACNTFDRSARSLDLPYWFGVTYRVDVSDYSFAAHPDPTNFYSYAYSHITIQYRIVRIYKNDTRVEFADFDDINIRLRPPHGEQQLLEIHNRFGRDGNVLNFIGGYAGNFGPGQFNFAERWFF